MTLDNEPCEPQPDTRGVAQISRRPTLSENVPGLPDYASALAACRGMLVALKLMPFTRSSNPWRLANLARTMIDRVVAQYQFAQVLGATNVGKCA